MLSTLHASNLTCTTTLPDGPAVTLLSPRLSLHLPSPLACAGQSTKLLDFPAPISKQWLFPGKWEGKRTQTLEDPGSTPAIGFTPTPVWETAVSGSLLQRSPRPRPVAVQIVQTAQGWGAQESEARGPVWGKGANNLLPLQQPAPWGREPLPASPHGPAARAPSLPGGRHIPLPPAPSSPSPSPSSPSLPSSRWIPGGAIS